LEEESIRRRIKLEQIEQERKDQERADRERRLVEEAQRKAQLDREKKETAELNAVREWERKQEEAKRSKEAAEAAAVREWERKQAEAKKKAKEAEDALKAKMAREAREAKEEEKRVLEEYKRKEKERAEEEARLEAEYERKRLEKEAKKKKDKEEEEQAFQEEMRKRLRALGYTEQTIEIMVNEEKAKQFKKEVESRSRSRENRPKVAVAPWEPPTRAPVYPKIHKKFLDVKTLEYYQLPWHYDVVSFMWAPPMDRTRLTECRATPTTSSSCETWTNEPQTSCLSTLRVCAKERSCSSRPRRRSNLQCTDVGPRAGRE
jgi:hypothetical protein